MSTNLPENLFPFILHFLRPYKFVIGIFILFAVSSGFWGPFNNILIKHVINILPKVQGGEADVLFFPSVLIVINFIVFDNFTWRGVGYINYKYQVIIKNKIIQEILEHILSKSNQFFQDNLSGRISSQIIMLADNIELILHRIMLDFIRGTSLLIISFITSFYVNPIFCYILVLWFICFLLFSIWMSKCLVSLADKHASSESLLSGQLVDVIVNYKNVQIFSQKIFELSRMNQFFHALKKTFQAKEKFIVILCSIQGVMIAIMMYFSIYFLIYFYSIGFVSVGDFALILGLSIELGYTMWYTMSRVGDFNQAYGKCKQSLSSLMLYQENHDKRGAQSLICRHGRIIFSNVKFHYKESQPLFENEFVTIEPRQKVGLVGHSGGGKSTFVNLILRLYNIKNGSILIDNQDIYNVTRDSLWRAISMIPQDPSLFHRSLMDNIRYGRIDATNEEIIEASKKAYAHEFISKLPDGYESLVGERGIKLSGGQRQRIAIARAILKNAPILILDEATSQLDSVTENLIQEGLKELMQNKTTIVIAHRLSTLLCMDRILVFDKGKIIEEGTHSELLSIGRIYKTLWDVQIGGFLGDKKS